MDDQPEAAVSDLLRRLLGGGGAVIGFPCVRCGADAWAPAPGAEGQVMVCQACTGSHTRRSRN
jgi:hypothetical protein